MMLAQLTPKVFTSVVVSLLLLFIVSPVSAAGVELHLTPSNTTAAVDQTLTFAVDLSAPTNAVSAVDLVLNYDANKLEGLTFTSTDYLATVLSKGVFSNGKAKMTLGAAIGSTQKGNGTIANVSFKVKSASSTQVTFDGATTVAAIESTANVLTKSTGANVNAGSNNTPPTTTPTVQATGKPGNTTPGATVAPSNQPNPSMTPVPTQTPPPVKEAWYTRILRILSSLFSRKN